LRREGKKERGLEDPPHLTANQLEAAIAYYEIHPEEVEAHIRAEAELDRELKRDPDVVVWEATDAGHRQQRLLPAGGGGGGGDLGGASRCSRLGRGDGGGVIRG